MLSKLNSNLPQLKICGLAFVVKCWLFIFTTLFRTIAEITALKTRLKRVLLSLYNLAIYEWRFIFKVGVSVRTDTKTRAQYEDDRL